MKLNETQRQRCCPAWQTPRTPQPPAGRCAAGAGAGAGAPSAAPGQPRLQKGALLGSPHRAWDRGCNLPPGNPRSPSGPSAFAGGSRVIGREGGREGGQEGRGGVSSQPRAVSSPLTPPTNEWCLLTPGNLPPAKHCSALQNRS